MPTSLPQRVINRFAGLLDENHQWAGPVRTIEYGQFKVANERYTSHVVAWCVYNNADVPVNEKGRKMDISHLCGIPTCCLGRHLIAESRGANLRRIKANDYPMAHEHDAPGLQRLIEVAGNLGISRSEVIDQCIRAGMSIDDISPPPSNNNEQWNRTTPTEPGHQFNITLDDS